MGACTLTLAGGKATFGTQFTWPWCGIPHAKACACFDACNFSCNHLFACLCCVQLELYGHLRQTRFTHCLIAVFWGFLESRQNCFVTWQRALSWFMTDFCAMTYSRTHNHQHLCQGRQPQKFLRRRCLDCWQLTSFATASPHADPVMMAIWHPPDHC